MGGAEPAEHPIGGIETPISRGVFLGDRRSDPPIASILRKHDARRVTPIERKGGYVLATNGIVRQPEQRRGKFRSSHGIHKPDGLTAEGVASELVVVNWMHFHGDLMRKTPAPFARKRRFKGTGNLARLQTSALQHAISFSHQSRAR
jgi:hypothetical protein